MFGDDMKYIIFVEVTGEEIGMVEDLIQDIKNISNECDVYRHN